MTTNLEEQDGLNQPLLPASQHQEEGNVDPRSEYRERDDVEEQHRHHPPPYEQARNASATATSDNEVRRRRQSSHRILDRDAAFYQSRGRWSVRHVSRGEARLMHTPEGERRRQAITKRFWNDWFHTLAYTKTYQLMIILFLIYTTIVFAFGFIYLFVSLAGQTTKINEDGATETELFCEMDIHDHMEALYLSLSTMTATGYGVSNYYFSQCWTPLILVLLQVCCAITFDAVAIGLLFQRISRGHKRAKTILFSDKATIRRVRGVPYLYIRLAELRHYQLLEATARAYCIRHERYRMDENTVETTHYITKPMKLEHEELGSHNIMMSLPQIVVHRMDFESPLVPPPSWCDANGNEHVGVNIKTSNAPEQASLQERFEEIARETTEIQSFLHDRETEIVVLLEGIDELTGSVIQTRHSYTYEELAWNQRFAPCTYPYSEYVAEGTDPERVIGRRERRTQPSCVVDFARFHDTIPAPLDSNFCPYVSPSK